MLTEARNNIRYFSNAIKVSIKSAMAYKASFIIQTIFMFLNNASFLIFWTVVFSKTGENVDITFNNVLYIWGLSSFAYGVTYFFFGGIEKINEYIITGGLDSFLLQPKGVLLNVATSKCSFSACGDVLYGIVVGMIASGGDISKVLMLMVFGTFGGVFFFASEVIFRSLSVWIGDTNAVADRYVQMFLITFSTYPENIFKVGTKILLYTVVPAAYLAFLPASIIESFSLTKLLIVIAVGLLYLFMAIKLFYKAISCYESGNNLAMKG